MVAGNDREVHLGICGICDADKQNDKNEITDDFEVFDKTAFWDLYRENRMKPSWNKIYYRTVITRNHLHFDESVKVGEDQLFNFKYMRFVDKMCLNRTGLYFYRKNPESLTHSYIDDFWNSYKGISRALKETVIACGIDFDSIATQYYGSYIDGVVWCLLNNMKPGSGRSFADRFLENCRILRSLECKEAWKRGAFPPMRPISRLIWKTRFYPLIWLYEKVSGAFAHKE